jgi:hypothetical protein
MRNTVIASSLVVVALGGLAGGVASASDSGASPAAPSTTLPGMDVFTDLGLTPEQGQCLVDNIGSVDTDDMTALFDVMTQCGITMDQLLQIGEASATTLPAVSAPSAPAVAVSSIAIDPASAAAALDQLGLDPVALECLAAASTPSAPADDAAAELIFEACGVGPLQVLEGILALHTAVGGGTTATTITPTTLTATTLSVATPATVTETGNAMVDILLQQLAAQGIILDPEQGQCLLDNISDIDPNDFTAIAAVLETCGIELSDIVPGG